jgi:hypothetical protein
MPGRGEIGPYHNKLASDVKELLGERVTFHTPEGEKWYGVRDGCGIMFDLVPVDPVTSETAMRMRREDGTTHRVDVFPLSTPSSCYLGTFWVSWHESWLKQNSAKYDLLNAGWTLFEGLPGSLDKVQVLRVDWDQLPHASPYAGHPHWHFDHDLFISAEPDRITTGPYLVEVNTPAASAMAKPLCVGFIHLAMGTWNKGEDHPKCWQRNYQDDCKQLRDWCVKTLKYLKEQVSGNGCRLSG